MTPMTLNPISIWGLLTEKCVITSYSIHYTKLYDVDANVALGFPADLRDYTICADMLKALGVNRVDLMTNNPRKIKSLQKLDIQVHARVPLQEGRNPYNNFYLNTKAGKLGHMLEQDDKQA